jgi:tetratricopeptide (TPR) repeat protein
MDTRRTSRPRTGRRAVTRLAALLVALCVLAASGCAALSSPAAPAAKGGPETLGAAENERIADNLVARGQNETALRHYNQALAEQPDNLALRLKKARLLDRQGAAELALAEYQEVVRRGEQANTAAETAAPGAETDAGAAAPQGMARSASPQNAAQAASPKDTAQAANPRPTSPQAASRQTLRPQDTLPLVARAREAAALLLFKGGMRDEAAAHARRAVEADAKLWRARMLLGVLDNYAERYEKAEIEFKAALQVSPDNPDVLNNLGMTYAMSGYPVEATMAFAEALRHAAPGPDEGRIANNLGLALCRMNRFDEALAAFRRAGGGEATARNNVGYYLYKSGRYADSLPYFEKALQLSPTYYERAAENLERARLALRVAGAVQDAHNGAPQFAPQEPAPLPPSPLTPFLQPNPFTAPTPGLRPGGRAGRARPTASAQSTASGTPNTALPRSPFGQGPMDQGVLEPDGATPVPGAEARGFRSETWIEVPGMPGGFTRADKAATPNGAAAVQKSSDAADKDDEMERDGAAEDDAAASDRSGDGETAADDESRTVPNVDEPQDADVSPTAAHGAARVAPIAFGPAAAVLPDAMMLPHTTVLPTTVQPIATRPAAAVTAAVSRTATPTLPAQPARLALPPYSVHVSSWRSETSAESDRERLAAQGLDAWTAPVDLGARGRWQRVYVGRFADRIAAGSACAELRAGLGRKDARVVVPALRIRASAPSAQRPSVPPSRFPAFAAPAAV